MSDHISLGRRQNDIGLTIDFHKKRAIVRANTKWIMGISLEDIPEGVNGYAPAMVLIDRNWKNVYFLIERKEWNDEEYFALAEKLMKNVYILKP